MLLFSFLMGVVNGFTQEIKKTQDIGFWISSSVAYKLKRGYKLKFSQDLRLHENSQEIEKYISDLGLDYKINKRFELGANLRYYMDKRLDKTIAQNWRYNVDFKYKKKLLKRTKLNYRLRFQSVYEDPFAVVSQGVKSNLRNLVGISYKINDRNRAEFDVELFRSIIAYRKPYFNKLRLSLGNKFDTSIGKIGVAFNYERELNSDYPFNFFFFSINHNLKLKR